ncbi:endospore germination permease [Desulfitobacterium sp. THU1]|uniref:GerAB/ArcD/ProY family transporter n=1 Tax=Desulfitobacterium sp. THU1 TaxID=3138072 RepID=UPI0031200C31
MIRKERSSMLEAGRITSRQLILLLVSSRILIGLTYSPALKQVSSPQDTWLILLLTFPLHVILATPVYFLAKKFPHQTVIQYSQTIAGKAGKVAGALLLCYLIHQLAINLALFSLFVTSVSMPTTPILFISLSLLLACAFASHRGVEVICRLGELFTPIIIIAIITITLLLTKDMQFKLLQPVLEKGIFPVLGVSFLTLSRTYELIEMAMLFPYLNQRSKVKSVYLFVPLIVALIFTMMAISLLTIFGTGAVSRMFPYLSMVREVHVGNIIERIESIHMAIWILGGFLKFSLHYYVIVLGLGQLINLQNYKPLILPTGAILASLSVLVAPSLVELLAFQATSANFIYNTLFIYVFPLLLLLLAIIQKKGVRSP